MATCARQWWRIFVALVSTVLSKQVKGFAMHDPLHGIDNEIRSQDRDAKGQEQVYGVGFLFWIPEALRVL